MLPTATIPSVTASSPSPSPSMSSSSPERRRRRRREEAAELDAAAAISGARGASLNPPPGHPLLYSPGEEATSCRGFHKPEAAFPGRSPSPGPPMEPLPTQGQTLRHYTASRPRPRRTHRQPPSSRPQVGKHLLMLRHTFRYEEASETHECVYLLP